MACSLKAVEKLVINTVGERDYSAQETCHLLLQLPMFKTSRDFSIRAWMGPVQLKIVWMKNNMLLHHLSLTIILCVQLLRHLLTSHFLSFLVNTSCQRHLGQSLLDEANELWGYHVPTALLTLLVPSMSSTVDSHSCSTNLSSTK